MDEQPAYFAFLLRIWKEKQGESSVWRAMLEDPHSGDRKGFPGLDALFTYLVHQTNHTGPFDPKKEF